MNTFIYGFMWGLGFFLSLIVITIIALILWLVISEMILDKKEGENEDF